MIPWGSEAQQAKIDAMDGWRLIGDTWHGPNHERLPAITGGQDPDPSDPFWLVLDLDDVTLGGVPLWELGEMTDWLNTTDWSRGVFAEPEVEMPAWMTQGGLTAADLRSFASGEAFNLAGGGADPFANLYVDDGGAVTDAQGTEIMSAEQLAEMQREITRAESLQSRMTLDAQGNPVFASAADQQEAEGFFAWLTRATAPLSGFLGTPTGRVLGGILGTLGLGGLGLAIGSAVAGGGGTFTPPAQQLTPGQQLVNRLLTENPQLSGVLSQALTTSLGAQQTVAQVLGEQAERELAAGRDQASVEADIRQQALGTLQAYLGGPPSVAAAMPGAVPSEWAPEDIAWANAYAKNVNGTYGAGQVSLDEFLQSRGKVPSGGGVPAVQGDAAARGISRSVTDLLAPVDPRQLAAQDRLTAQIRALVARQAGANLSGQPDEIAEGFRRSLTSLFGAGTTDPVTEALQARVLAAARGETPSPMLERLEREEMDQLLNEFARRGPQYAESSAGIEKLARLRQMQTERRDNQILATLSALEPQLVQRELLPGQRAGQIVPLLQAREILPNLQLSSVANVLGGRESSALGIANFLANQAEQRRAGAQSLAGTGRTSPLLLQSPLASIASIPSITGVSDLNAGVRAQNDLNQRLAFAAFDAEQAARAGLGSGISQLFAQAAGTGFRLAR